MCRRCGRTYPAEEGLLMSETNERGVSTGDAWPVCSIMCLIDFSQTLNGLMLAAHWVFAGGVEGWVRIGRRGWRRDSKWSLTDTGEARWIEENAARLRAAGEIA